MTDRARLVYALLRTLLSWTPDPRSPTRLDTTDRGFVPAKITDERGRQRQVRYLTCPDCLTNGKTMPGCETCGGRGEIPDEGKDPYDIGRAAGVFGGTAGDDARHARAQRDRLLRQLEQDESIRLGEIAADDPLTRSIARRDALYRKGSYRQLEMALGRLRRLDPQAYTLAMSVAYQPFGEAPIDLDQQPENIQQLCELLGVWITGPIHVPEFIPISASAEIERLCREGKGALRWGQGEWHKLKRAERNQLIVRLREEGKSPTAIALLLNLTRRRVQQILAEHDQQEEAA